MLAVGWRNGVDSGCRSATSGDITDDGTIRHLHTYNGKDRMFRSCLAPAEENLVS